MSERKELSYCLFNVDSSHRHSETTRYNSTDPCRDRATIISFLIKVPEPDEDNHCLFVHSQSCSRNGQSITKGHFLMITESSVNLFIIAEVNGNKIRGQTVGGAHK
jgi:hypothetical protein